MCRIVTDPAQTANCRRGLVRVKRTCLFTTPSVLLHRQWRWIESRRS